MPYQVEYNDNALESIEACRTQYRRFNENAESLLDTLRRNPSDSNFCKLVDQDENLWVSYFFDPISKHKIVFSYLIDESGKSVLIVDIRGIPTRKE